MDLTGFRQPSINPAAVDTLERWRQDSQFKIQSSNVRGFFFVCRKKLEPKVERGVSFF